MKQLAQAAMVLFQNGRCGYTTARLKDGRSCSFAGILLPLVHLFLECLGLLLIHK